MEGCSQLATGLRPVLLFRPARSTLQSCAAVPLPGRESFRRRTSFSPPSSPPPLDLSSPRFPTDMASHPATTATYPPPYSQANPIDLTLDDDDDDIHLTQRMSKRPCTLSRVFNASHPSASTPSSSYSRQSSSGLSPAMSHSTLAPPDGPYMPSGSHTPQASSSTPYYRDDYDSPSPNALRFMGPSNSSAFFQPEARPPSVNPLEYLPPPPPPRNDQHPTAARQVIDLTGSPSPPPFMRPPQPPPPPPQMYPQTPAFGNLPPDLPPKTPVCIGVLAATALVLYPIPFLTPHDLHNPDGDWAPVRLHYEHNATKPSGSTETINIRPPSMKGPNGDIIPGETFAVVEQKVATVLGPMLGKGLIRLDAKIRRTNRAVSAHISYGSHTLTRCSCLSYNCNC